MRQLLSVSMLYQHSMLVLLLLLLGACAAPPVVQLPEPVEQVIVVPEPEPEPEPESEPEIIIAPILQSKHIAIVVSADFPALEVVAIELGRQIGTGQYSIYSLHGKSSNAKKVLAEVLQADTDQVVAIGMLAAQAVQKYSDLPTVFCQTFNYQDYNFIEPNFKGVSLLPPFELQFAAWQELAPQLKSIGVVSGPGHEGLIKQIEAAATKHALQVVHRSANTDKAALLEFKRLNPEVQGIILLPDNRILSPAVLREILTYGFKHRTQIAVYGSGMLQLGALVSFTVPPDALASAALERLATEQADGVLPGPAMTSAQGIQVEVNKAVAEHLGLTVPASFLQIDNATRQY